MEINIFENKRYSYLREIEKLTSVICSNPQLPCEYERDRIKRLCHELSIEIDNLTNNEKAPSY